jgi:hypothetical protein
MPSYDTQANLITAVLQRVVALQNGTAPDADDVSQVTSQLDWIYRKLAQLEIVYVADPSQIPSEWMSDLADIVAGEVANSFGVTPEDYIKLKNAGLGGAQETDIGAGAAAISLRWMNRSRPTGEPLKTTFF